MKLGLYRNMRFLLIEDNQALANAVIERLSLDSHIVDHAADLTTAWDYTATAEYDLILLDIMLPDGDGRSFWNSIDRPNHAHP